MAYDRRAFLKTTVAGHFLPEEVPEETLSALLGFLS